MRALPSSSRSLVSRRTLLAVAGQLGVAAAHAASAPPPAKPAALRLALSEWSLHRTIFSGKLDHLEFPRTAKQEFGIDTVEYGNQFFKDKAKDADYLADLAKRATDEGVTGVLVSCDGLGNLGDRDAKGRTQAVENHFPWVEAAKRLGCAAIRVTVGSKGAFEEQRQLAADGLARLAEFAAQLDMLVLVENAGGLSSNGEWLASVVKLVAKPSLGTLPDVGGFHDYDRYRGLRELLPFAKGLTAKSHEFDAEGNEVRTDYRRMLEIVLEAGYRGWVSIEYEGKSLSEAEGIAATKKLLERLLSELT